MFSGVATGDTELWWPQKGSVGFSHPRESVQAGQGC